MARIELRGISKGYPGGFEAVSGIDLEVADGVFLAVVGPSGAGKSTLLRLVAGLEPIDAGCLRIDGRRADRLAPRDRDVGMVLQGQAPYPHLTVFENLAFGLRARHLPFAEVRRRVEETAAPLGLTSLLGRLPKALSGGERQRVVLGRAVARRPGLILLDEPLANLDAPLRAAIRADLIDLHRRLGTTMILVTHDQAEAMAVGDRVAIMERGRLVQVGPPLEVYDRPATRFVARFIGSPPMNLLPCEVALEGGSLRLRVAGVGSAADWIVPRGTPGTGPPERLGAGTAELGLRPESLWTAEGPPVDPTMLVLGTTVQRLEPLGHEVLATIAVGPHEVVVRLSRDGPARVGEPLSIRLDLGRAHWFNSTSGTRLS